MPAVCLAENLVIGPGGALRLAPHSVPRNVVDVIAHASEAIPLGGVTSLPGRLMIDRRAQWTNDTPVDHTIRIEVTRRWKRVVVSNPNAIQFRDRWSTALTVAGSEFIDPEVPVVSGIFNSQCGVAGDVGTNTVAEPNPGKFWTWYGTNTAEEWISPVLAPGDTLALWYRLYVWTPPPFSDNANKNAPDHQAEAGWTRLQMMAMPGQGKVVQG